MPLLLLVPVRGLLRPEADTEALEVLKVLSATFSTPPPPPPQKPSLRLETMRSMCDTMGGGVGGRAGGGGPDGVKGDCCCDRGYAWLSTPLPRATAEADTPAPPLGAAGVEGAAAAAAAVAAVEAIVA